MKRETAAEKQRYNTTVCECGHSQAWHWGITHEGPCQFPGCEWCLSFREQK